MSVNYGSKRITTGARYGLRDWLAQRITAALMAAFTLLVLVQFIFTSGPCWLRTMGWYFCLSMDEVFDLRHHPFFALSRLDWHP
jgi:succinate dehydrogenase / fumarate reductase, membrane anchor subunit